jgi:uncharacterized protein
MNTTTNMQLVEAVFAALAQGNTKPFADAMADDFSWTSSGHGPWSRTGCGKQQVRQGLMAPLFAQFADTYRNCATRVVAEGGLVVVECRGEVMTKTGRRYDNHYCHVIEMRDCQMHALTEHTDTALAEAVLTAPA